MIWISDDYLQISIKRNPKISQPTSEEVTFLPIENKNYLSKLYRLCKDGILHRVLRTELGKSTRGRTEKDLHSHTALLRGEKSNESIISNWLKSPCILITWGCHSWLIAMMHPLLIVYAIDLLLEENWPRGTNLKVFETWYNWICKNNQWFPSIWSILQYFN